MVPNKLFLTCTCVIVAECANVQALISVTNLKLCVCVCVDVALASGLHSLNISSPIQSVSDAELRLPGSHGPILSISSMEYLSSEHEHLPTGEGN